MPVEGWLGDWKYKIRTTRNGSPGQFIGWCAKVDDLCDSPLLIDPSIEVHAVFADSVEDVIAALRKEVMN